ncbi:ras-related and estrogen-regulated growth inhibitor-like [Limulus polyphemus]|uniref:small monomeric GTPase n=1 Tax=Limulus polyphemus TaxID=6850 RepID=A0ABM1C5G1_LIMPO|nr:ras-related and estrogen-regulated growth inhibitor-like [Limulus polyphemus]
MTSKSRLGFLKLGLSSFRIRDSYCNIVVLGAEEVGKTALVVRFFTKKYLPEYSHSPSTCYERNVSLNDKMLPVRVLDTSGKESFTSLKARGTLDGAHGYVVVYSVTDKRSFFKARDLLKLLNDDFGNDGRTPIAIIGNKDDLGHLRSVSAKEAQRISLTYPRCTFQECSAAREAHNVETAFQDFLQQVIQSKGEKRPLSALAALTSKSQNPRRNSAGNFTLNNWWRRPRFSSERDSRQDRTFTM